MSRDKIVPLPGVGAGAGDRWWSIRMAGDRRAEIHLRGTIGVPKAYNDYGADAAGTAREFEEELRALGEVSEITLYVASLGGYVYDALVIHDVLARQSARVTAVVDGIAASAASFVILAADTIRMPANAYLMIHNAQGFAVGDHRQMLDMAESLERWTNDIAKLYARRIGNTDEETLARIRGLMDAETWITGEEAREMGLVDEVTGAVELAASAVPLAGLPGIRTERMPDAVRALIDKPAPEMSAEATPQNDAAPAVETTEAAPVSEAVPVTNETDAQAPVNDGAQAPALAPAPAPAPAGPANGADLASLLNAAVADALKPIVDRLDKIENCDAVTASGAKPWPNGKPVDHPATGAEADNVIDFSSATPMNRIALGRKLAQKALAPGRN